MLVWWFLCVWIGKLVKWGVNELLFIIEKSVEEINEGEVVVVFVVNVVIIILESN